MSNVLELYQKVLNDKGIFTNEIFKDEVYSVGIDKKVIVDLGAYEGEFGYYCYNFASKIYAIEPDIKPFEVLKKNVEDFKLDKFSIFNIGISGQSGRRKFSAPGSGASTFYRDLGHLTEVDTLSLDDFIKQNEIKHIDILKIDVEGSENEIFNETSKETFSIIDKIVGEAHISSDMGGILGKQGFKVQFFEHQTFLATK